MDNSILKFKASGNSERSYKQKEFTITYVCEE